MKFYELPIGAIFYEVGFETQWRCKIVPDAKNPDYNACDAEEDCVTFGFEGDETVVIVTKDEIAARIEGGLASIRKEVIAKIYSEFANEYAKMRNERDFRLKNVYNESIANQNALIKIYNSEA